MLGPSLRMRKKIEYPPPPPGVCGTACLLIWRLSRLAPFVRCLKSPFYLTNISVTKIIRSSLYRCTIKTFKCLLKKPTNDGINEAKEIYTQLSFEIYKGKLVLRF